MKLFGNRKGAEHIAARKTEKKTGGLKRWQRVTIIVAAIVLVLGGTALAVYKVNVKPPVKQPEPVETEPLPEEETEEPPLPEGIRVLHRSAVGRVITYIVRGSREEVLHRMQALSPLLLEAIPLTLEEIFIYELGGADYAVRDIVL